MILENEYLLKIVSEGEREDKRKFDEFRKISIEKNVVEKAEGSALVKIGDTQVMAGVKMEVGEPFPDTPNEGILIVNAEFSPIASPEFESGPPGEDATELARVVDRGIRESKAIDMEKLCIEEGKKVWIVFLDIYILDHHGNLIDAAALASLAALLNTKMPKYDGEKINYEEKTKKLPMRFKPIAITVVKINNHLLIDPSLEEEKVMDARLTVTTKEDGNICALQKGGSGGFTFEEIKQAIELSKKKGKELRKLLEK